MSQNNATIFVRALLFASVLHMSLKTVHSAICSFSDGNYLAQWSLDPSGSQVNIQLQFHNFPGNADAWTGIAFGDTMYSGLDAIIVRVIEGKVMVTDEYVQGYRPSFTDQIQDVRVQQAQYVNGVLNVQVSRPVQASNYEDHSINGCTNWQFITGPGTASFNHVGKHTRLPIGRTVCLRQCRTRK